MQREIAGLVARALEIELLAGEAAATAWPERTTAAAYEAFLKGNYHWHRLSREHLAKSVEHFREAVELDPLSVLARVQLGGLCLETGDPDEAVRQAREAIELDPRAPYPHTLLAWAHWEQEDRDHAVAGLERAFEVAEGSGRSPLDLAWAYAQTGRRDEARALVEEAITGPGAELLSPVLVAGARHALGDTGEARALLERALAAGDDRLLGWHVTRLLTGVRADPAFADLPARIGLPEPAGPAAGQ